MGGRVEHPQLLHTLIIRMFYTSDHRLYAPRLHISDCCRHWMIIMRDVQLWMIHPEYSTRSDSKVNQRGPILHNYHSNKVHLTTQYLLLDHHHACGIYPRNKLRASVPHYGATLHDSPNMRLRYIFFTPSQATSMPLVSATIIYIRIDFIFICVTYISLS